MLLQRVDRWHDKAHELNGALVYERPKKGEVEWPLLISPESTVPTLADRVFVVANSMRDVQPEFNLLVSPSSDKLAFREPPDAPDWDFSKEDDE